jgi:SRSO17 transposase
LAYAIEGGYAFLDRALYVPKSWTADPDRCAAAGIPGGVEFATKPAMDRRMLATALDAGTPAGWVAGDEVYGVDPRLRADLVGRRVGYVLAVACHHPIHTPGGTMRADQLTAGLPRRAWQPASAGAGAKGPPVL